jgi:starch phosphorylase
MNNSSEKPLLNGGLVAYFSMEVALEAGMPTYSGGLGVLAGDTLRAAADLQVPMLAITLLHRRGYFIQKVNSSGIQTEQNNEWKAEDFLQEMPFRVSVPVEGRNVSLRCWRYEIKGSTGFAVPIYFLDSNLPENSEWDRTLTDVLYGGDAHYRLCQEVLLGIGGVRMFRALGCCNIARFHMNEGHASMLTLELLNEFARKNGREIFNHDDVQEVRKLCVFTTHTPVPAGHDQFPLELVARVIGRSDIFALEEVFCCEGVLNMTYLALNLSHYVNGVAKKHGEVSRQILVPKKEFIHYQIDSITNGIHAATWTSPSIAELFDRYIPGWREDNSSLRNVMGLSPDAIWDAHAAAKKALLDFVNRQSEAEMNTDALTIGFARRATAYKRADLIFSDIERLRSLSTKTYPLQIIFAGKAHPQDAPGKETIRKIHQARELLKNEIKIIYLPNYDMELARLLIAGVDVWLNTPQPPLEASGTSGMKAALNGVPSLSILDGWWIEGCIKGVTGWPIGESASNVKPPNPPDSDADSLYDQLEYSVIPTFYRNRDHFVEIMRNCIALNGSHFNTQRMLQQYVLKAYFI